MAENSEDFDLPDLPDIEFAENSVLSDSKEESIIDTPDISTSASAPFTDSESDSKDIPEELFAILQEAMQADEDDEEPDEDEDGDFSWESVEDEESIQHKDNEDRTEEIYKFAESINQNQLYPLAESSLIDDDDEEPTDDDAEEIDDEDEDDEEEIYFPENSEDELEEPEEQDEFQEDPNDENSEIDAMLAASLDNENDQEFEKSEDHQESSEDDKKDETKSEPQSEKKSSPFQNYLNKVKSELHGGEEPEPNENQDSTPIQKSPVNLFYSLWGFISHLYKFVIDFFFEVITFILRIIAVIPLIGRLAKLALAATSVLRAIAMLMPPVFIVGSIILTNMFIIPKSADIELPDSGGASISEMSYDSKTGEVTGTLKNTGDVIAQVSISFDVYSTSLTINPVSWFSPTKKLSCTSDIVSVDIDSQTQVKVFCGDKPSGFFYRVKGSINE